MPDILVRGLSVRVVRQLRARAKQHGRSLEDEAKAVLEQAAGVGTAEVAKILDKWKKEFAGRKFSSSVDMIREDRSR